MELSRAKSIADNLVTLLAPHCEPGMCIVAGGIRREKEDPHDIEIVAYAKRSELKDMFGDVVESIPNDTFTRVVSEFGNVIKGKSDGRMMQIMLPEAITVDLFMPTKEDFWRNAAIRTGSAKYAHEVIAVGWHKIGWCGTENGLRLKDECIPYMTGGNRKWKCITDQPTLPPVWESEEHFFEWIGIKWIEPKLRNL